MALILYQVQGRTEVWRFVSIHDTKQEAWSRHETPLTREFRGLGATRNAPLEAGKPRVMTVPVS
jgi:hypothetical protein